MIVHSLGDVKQRGKRVFLTGVPFAGIRGWGGT